MPQPVKVIALIKAKPGMTREQLKKRWVDEHCPLTIKMKNLKGGINAWAREVDQSLPVY